LKPNEKKLLFPAIGIGTGIVPGRCTLPTAVVLPKALSFFYEFANPRIASGLDAGQLRHLHHTLHPRLRHRL
jgi:hypothetical protein